MLLIYNPSLHSLDFGLPIFGGFHHASYLAPSYLHRSLWVDVPLAHCWSINLLCSSCWPHLLCSLLCSTILQWHHLLQSRTHTRRPSIWSYLSCVTDTLELEHSHPLFCHTWTRDPAFSGIIISVLSISSMQLWNATSSALVVDLASSSQDPIHKVQLLF